MIRAVKLVLAIAVVALLLVLVVMIAGAPSAPAPTPTPSASTSRATTPPPTATLTTAPATTCTIRGVLPDPVCTPGATDPHVTQANIASTICLAGYTTTVRPPTSYTNPLKLEQMRAYGDTGTPANYEEDHLIPLELGGDPRDPRNLWPEPRVSIGGRAEDKDQVENALHADVCAGRRTLSDAQRAIATDWTTAR